MLMKRNSIPAVIMLFLIFVAALSCREQQIVFNGPDYVRFTDTSLVFKESLGKVVPVTIHLVGKPSDRPVTVTYSVGGTAVEGRDYSIIGEKGVVTIPAGSLFGEISLHLINNSNNILRSSELLFTISNASQGEKPIQVGAGKNFLMGNSLRIVIEDDCLFGGYYNGKRTGYDKEVKDIAITSTDCYEYLLANWNIGILSFNADKVTLRFLDNGDNSITIPSQYNVVLGDTLLGNGAWDPKTRQIILNVAIKTLGRSGADTLINIPQLTYVPR